MLVNDQTQDAFDPSEERDEHGRWTLGSAEHPASGKTAGPGFVRVFHGTSSEVLASVKQHGIAPHHTFGGDYWLQHFNPQHFNTMMAQAGPDYGGNIFVTKQPAAARNFAELTTLVAEVRAGVKPRAAMPQLPPIGSLSSHPSAIPPLILVADIPRRWRAPVHAPRYASGGAAP
jgi:hypothetical protein